MAGPASRTQGIRVLLAQLPRQAPLSAKAVSRWRERWEGRPATPSKCRGEPLPPGLPHSLSPGAAFSLPSVRSLDYLWEGSSSSRRTTWRPARRKEEGLASRLVSAWASPSTC